MLPNLDPETMAGRCALLAAGGVLALLAQCTLWTWIALQFVLTLSHELGHSIVATFFGAPAFPVIRLDGHAAALYGDPILLLQVAIFATLVAFAWQQRSRRGLRVPLAIAVVAYPVIALSGLWGLCALLAGQLGELTFAGVFLFRAWTGGFTHNLSERVLYAMLGLHGLFAGCGFHVKLAFDRGFQARYEQSGSFGLTNDYVRVAGEWFGCSVPSVALLMLLLSLIALPIGLVVAGGFRGN